MGRHDVLMPRITYFARDELVGTHTARGRTIVYATGRRELPPAGGQAGAPGARQPLPGDLQSGATGQ